jgi:hypothetical protein
MRLQQLQDLFIENVKIMRKNKIKNFGVLNLKNIWRVRVRGQIIF